MNFVTGGTGLLGSHLLFKLISEHQKVRAVYRDEHRLNRVYQLFEYYRPADGKELFEQIEWCMCDILDVVQLEKVMKGCTTVYHCAAMISYNKKDFLDMMKINREGTFNIVNISLLLGIEKVCFVSSTSAVSVNEENRKAPLIEANKWVQTTETSGYAISKYSAEKEIWRGIEEGLNAVIINPSVIIGPGIWEESSLTIFKLISNKFRFYTKGGNAFVDVRDVVNSMFILTEDKSIYSERYLCTGHNLLFYELFKLISKELNQPPPSIYANTFLSKLAQSADWFKGLFTGKRTLTGETVRTSRKITEYDSSKLKAVTGRDFYPIEETIRNTVQGRLSNH